MLKRVLIVCCVLVFMVGCATSSKRLNNLHVGMTKAEVIEILGEPSYTSAVEDVEILTYKLRTDTLFSKVYLVKIINGKVEQFGTKDSAGFYAY